MIQENAKKIIAYLLKQIIDCGGALSSPLFIHYGKLAEELKLESESLCRVCCNYLFELGYVKFIRSDDDDKLCELTAKGIDFLESK